MVIIFRDLVLRLLCTECRFGQEKYYEAIADLGSLLKTDPSDTNALYLRSMSYYYLAEYDAARKQIKEIMKYDQDHVGARDLNKRLGDYLKAVKKGRAALADSNIEEGISFLLKAAAVDPSHHLQNTKISVEICEAYMTAKDKANAKRFCETSMQEDHDQASEICVKYANFHLNHCDSEDAYDENMRIWHRCREINGGDTRETQEGRMKSENLKKRFKQKDRDYYGVLGVAKDADAGEIRKKYRKLAKEMHPDRFVGSSEEEMKEVEQKFQKVAQAYEILSDEDLRAKYDRGEDVENPNAQSQQHRGFHGFPFQFQRGSGQTLRFHF